MDIIQLLQESAKLDEDIQDIMDSANPPANLVSESFDSLVYECDNYINEAVIDYRLYKQQALQLMIESASSMNEETMKAMQKAISEGVAAKGYTVATRIVQAIKGLIRRAQTGIAKIQANSVYKYADKHKNELDFSEDDIETLNQIIDRQDAMTEVCDKITNGFKDGISPEEAMKLAKKVDEIASMKASVSKSSLRSNDPKQLYAAAKKVIDTALEDSIKIIKSLNKLVKEIDSTAMQMSVEDARYFNQQHVKLYNKLLAANIHNANTTIKSLRNALRGAVKTNAQNATQRSISGDTAKKEEKGEDNE